MNKNYAKEPGNMIGELLETDCIGEGIQLNRSFLRFQVAIDINHPLLPSYNLKRNDLPALWIELSYERLSNKKTNFFPEFVHRTSKSKNHFFIKNSGSPGKKNSGSVYQKIKNKIHSTLAVSRQALWHRLSMILNATNKPHVLIGDLNVVGEMAYKSGGNYNISRQIHELQGFISSTNLIEIPFKGLSYAWTNKRLDS
ncbi:hypothetical protein POM88_024086 [Heracleum sosnowskyi]|uniref:Endonuclease/exonuclease/phosphatase domain-containing protein n=1 Tax=Heracleum sosnowskyi TaxID=360622 RepID=A0AAD8IK23_9APIA|nr:hypothetical protein POM88_024086 [Heracleum sosnowskyi]